MKLVIIAGGKGTRLGLKDIPKPMVKIANKTVLEHQIDIAKQYGIRDIYILSGHFADVIIDYFKDGSEFGVNITHIVENAPLGPAGAVKQLEGVINERFMVFYGDVLFDIDLESFVEFDRKALSIATLIVHPNDHPWDSDLLDIDEYGVVTAFHSKPHDAAVFHRNLVNAAVYILDPGIFKYVPLNTHTDFGKDIFPLLMRNGEIMRAYKTAEYLKDLGTVDRLEKVRGDYISGRIAALSKKNKRPAIFIDRDGTLIEYVDLLCSAEDVRMFPFAGAAIRKINQSEYLSFLVTNQPVVARNLCDVSGVRHIHNKIETILGSGRAYLNDIYFCPHHPDKGYPNENRDYKIDCLCRKPKTGMIQNAAAEYNVDMSSSWFIGDTTVDIETGKNAGLNTVLVKTGKAGLDNKFQCEPDFISDNLESAVDFILKL